MCYTSLIVDNQSEISVSTVEQSSYVEIKLALGVWVGRFSLVVSFKQNPHALASYQGHLHMPCTDHDYTHICALTHEAVMTLTSL